MLHNLFQYGFAGIAGLCFLGAWLSRARRGVLIWAGLAAAIAGIGAHYDIFWTIAMFGLMVPWALFCARQTIDLAWRVKTGFVLFLALGAALCIYPTFHDERYGRVVVDGTPEERAEISRPLTAISGSSATYWNIPFRLVRRPRSSKGGLRLVYTVDVDEAIKDKRDHYYDEMRSALATAFGFHTGDKRPTRGDVTKLHDKVDIEAPRDQVDAHPRHVQGRRRLDEDRRRFLKKFLGELALQRSADGRRTFKFRIRAKSRARIRERAVTQAKDTVHRRVDELGLREAAVTTRDEDIIVEVPGEDEASFAEIRDIISQTARLEFKMVDDDIDFFGRCPRPPRPTSLPEGLDVLERENAPVGQDGRARRSTQVDTYAVSSSAAKRDEHADA